MYCGDIWETSTTATVTFSADIPERLPEVEWIFAHLSGKAIDPDIAAAGIDAPERPLLPADDRQPLKPGQVNLASADISSTLKATGSRLNFAFVEMPFDRRMGLP